MPPHGAHDLDPGEGTRGAFGFAAEIPWSAEDSGSETTSFTSADESRYTTASIARGTVRE